MGFQETVEKELRNLRNGRVTLALALLLIAWLVLPTGDLTDVFITLPLLEFLGVKVFVALCFAIILVLWVYFTHFKKRV